MKIWKQMVLFYIGGAGYMAAEICYRGWSHGSMFLAGGICFLLLGNLQGPKNQMPWLLRMIGGAGVITGIEYASGLLFNRNYEVWDYRNLPLNYQGQICIPFSLLWIPVAYFACRFYDLMDKWICRQKNLPMRSQKLLDKKAGRVFNIENRI